MIDSGSTTAFINGLRGRYSKQASGDSFNYGRNAISNQKEYLAGFVKNDTDNIPPVLDFSTNPEADENNEKKLKEFINKNQEYLDSLPPLQYEYRYMPNIKTGKIDKKALLGAAFEEMGKKEMSVKEFEENFLISENMTAEPLDINKDGKIDIAEYSTNILMTDLLSKGTNDISKIDGTINSKGTNAIFDYALKSNASAAAKMYSELYNKYQLGNALNEVSMG